MNATLWKVWLKNQSQPLSFRNSTLDIIDGGALIVKTTNSKYVPDTTYIFAAGNWVEVKGEHNKND